MRYESLYNVVGMKYFKGAATLFAVLCALISFICPTLKVKAEAFRYAYVDEGVIDAYFCTSKDLSSSVFAIPDTYCVEILKEDGDWYYCRYAKDEGAYVAVRGYCLKSKLKLIEEPLENEYLNLPIEVSFSADKASPSFPFEIKLMLPFYGKGKMNASDLVCVYYDGEFQYVSDDLPRYDKNPLPQPVISTDVTDGDKGNATLITAIVITAVAVVAVVVLYIASKRPKLPPKPKP